MKYDERKNYLGPGMAIGIAIGSISGVALDNICLWVAIGLAFGAGIGSRLNQKERKENDKGAILPAKR